MLLRQFADVPGFALERFRACGAAVGIDGLRGVYSGATKPPPMRAGLRAIQFHDATLLLQSAQNAQYLSAHRILADEWPLPAAQYRIRILQRE